MAASAAAAQGAASGTGSPQPDLPRRDSREPSLQGQDFLGGQHEATQQARPAWQDDSGPRPSRFDAPDQRYEAPGYAPAREPGERTRFEETRLDNSRSDGRGPDGRGLDRVPVTEPKRRSDRRKSPRDPAETQVDGTPVYQTGMQLVVPTGQEWTFRDPGTGAFPGVQQDRASEPTQRARTFRDRISGAFPSVQQDRASEPTQRARTFRDPGSGAFPGAQQDRASEPTQRARTFRDSGGGAFPGAQQDRAGDQAGQQQTWTFRDPGTGAFPGAQQDWAGDQAQQESYGRGGRGGPATYPPVPPRGQSPEQPAPRGPAPRQAAPQPGTGPDMAPDTSGGRRRRRKAPVLIGVGALVVVVGIGAAVEAPKFLRHTDPGCAAYTASALPAYNKTITDLNAQASQATLSNDLTTAVAQLSSATGQAQSATVKSALQGLLSQLTQVQADVQKGSVPAATVAQLNTNSNAADNAC
jgi:hypothetical protein